jgi:hypothetical protein
MWHMKWRYMNTTEARVLATVQQERTSIDATMSTKASSPYPIMAELQAEVVTGL